MATLMSDFLISLFERVSTLGGSMQAAREINGLLTACRSDGRRRLSLVPSIREYVYQPEATDASLE
jgi:hypothetical protein